MPQRKQADSFCTNGHAQIGNGEEPSEISCTWSAGLRHEAREYFGLGAVLGEMSVLVAVPALHVLGGVVSVGQPLHRHAAILGSVVDPGLKQQAVTCLEYDKKQVIKKSSKLSVYTSVSTRRRHLCVACLHYENSTSWKRSTVA